MNEEAVGLGKKQLQEGLTYDQVVFLFIKQTSGVVEDTVQIFKDEKDEFGAIEQSKLPRVEEELHYFFLFALDYWWQKSPSYTQKQKLILEKVLIYHLDIGFDDDVLGRVAWDTLQERFIAYGQIANGLEQKDYSVMLHDFAKKLSEYCGVGYISFAILAPSLFKTALDTISVLKSDKRRSR
jgi:hypothetical protein